MKGFVRLIAVTAGILVSQVAMAQAPAGAPAGATGVCKDGTYSMAASKSGACGGHKGVQTWYAAAAAKPAKVAAAAAPVAAPAPAAVKSAAVAAPAAKAAATAPAPGGGPGMVWVNTSTKVYHCPGTKYYGTTKDGKYMTEAAAKAMGAHADHGNACSK